jgi:hypothetical protein
MRRGMVAALGKMRGTTMSIYTNYRRHMISRGRSLTYVWNHIAWNHHHGFTGTFYRRPIRRHHRYLRNR